MKYQEGKCVVYGWHQKADRRINSLVQVDMADYQKSMQVNVYVPNRYEGEGKGCPMIKNEIQNRTILAEKLWNEGYECFLNIENLGIHHHNITIWVTDSENPYYEIAEI